MKVIIKGNPESINSLLKKCISPMNRQLKRKLPYMLIGSMYYVEDSLKELCNELDCTLIEVDDNQERSINPNIVNNLIDIACKESTRLENLADVIEEEDPLAARSLRFDAHKVGSIIAILSYSFPQCF